ncbi:MAG: DUF58 domain-containing protein [Bacteroidia bacterium]|nr:DUF58 domain-containing protein [Bacteroidia bacterium]
METTDLLKKVRKLEIRARGLSNQLFAGEYHSAFKGRGMLFSEVREYQEGDDVRHIDNNVTARFGHPYVKVYEEERELTVMLLVDMSASGLFGTRLQTKRERIAELCAILAFAAMNNNDKIGMLLFTSDVELVIPPSKGKKHVLRIIRDILEFSPQKKGTDLNPPLRYFRNAIKKKSTGFLISDFQAPNYEEALKITSRKHDLVALRVYDETEMQLPDVGLVDLVLAETGETVTADTSSAKWRTAFRAHQLEKLDYLKKICKKNRVDLAQVNTSENVVPVLLKLFEQRIHA